METRLWVQHRGSRLESMSREFLEIWLSTEPLQLHAEGTQLKRERSPCGVEPHRSDHWTAPRLGFLGDAVFHAFVYTSVCSTCSLVGHAVTLAVALRSYLAPRTSRVRVVGDERVQTRLLWRIPKFIFQYCSAGVSFSSGSRTRQLRHVYLLTRPIFRYCFSYTSVPKMQPSYICEANFVRTSFWSCEMVSPLGTDIFSGSMRCLDAATGS